MNLTKTFIDNIEGEVSKLPDIPLMIEYANTNKVLLHFLRIFNVENALRKKQEIGLRNIYESLIEIARLIQNIDYAVIKFFKPLAYVPSDIDLLVKREDLSDVLRKLQSIGYKPSVYEANCISLEGKTIVDLYLNPDFMNIPYTSGEKLLKYVQVKRLKGVKIKALKPEAEAILALSHAIYKEQIITLNDYYTAKFYLNDKSLEIAEELKVLDAILYSMNFLKQVKQGLVNLPYKIPIRDVIKLFSVKIKRDPLSRKSLPNIGLKLFDRRVLMLIKSRFFRETY